MPHFLAYWLYSESTHKRRIQQVARADGVDPDAELGQVQGDALRQADAAEFGGGIGGILETALFARFGIDLDDGTAALLEHHSGCMFGDEHVAKEVDVHHELPFVCGEVPDRLGDKDAGIGNDDVQAAKSIDRCLNHRFHLRFVGDIDFDGDDTLSGSVGDDIGGLLSAFEIEISDNDIAAFFGQSLAKRRASPCAPPVTRAILLFSVWVMG